MARTRPHDAAAVGAVENGNSVVLVTVAATGDPLDRRRVDLTKDLPTHPYHHEGSWAVGRYLDSAWARPIALADAIALVHAVHRAALAGAREALAALAAGVSVQIAAIAIRACAELPATVEERIVNTRAACMADSIMYRQALATAATERGWTVRWYDRARAADDAARAFGVGSMDAHLRAMGRSMGAPWQAPHKLAAAAALAAVRRRDA